MNIFPPPGSQWPSEIQERFGEASQFAKTNEVSWSRDLSQVIGQGHFEPPPWNEIIGHVRPRGGPAGLIILGGKIVAEWGDTSRPDMTFSCAKSCI